MFLAVIEWLCSSPPNPSGAKLDIAQVPNRFTPSSNAEPAKPKTVEPIAAPPATPIEPPAAPK